MKNIDELLDKYDEIINITMSNIYTLCKNDGEIIISNLDRKNKDHLFILRVALLAKDIFNFPLKIQTSWWNWLILNWKMRKISRRIPREKKKKPMVNTLELIEFMYPPIKEYMEEDFKFEHIYNQFYKGELD